MDSKINNIYLHWLYSRFQTYYLECFAKSLLVFRGSTWKQKGYYHPHNWRTQKYQFGKKNCKCKH